MNFIKLSERQWVLTLIFVCSILFVPSVGYSSENILEAFQNALTSTIEKSKPAVVHITPSQLTKQDKADGIKADPQQGSGSGVIISLDGVIVTNAHVVASAKIVNVTLLDGRTFKGNVLGRDKDTDLAVIKIEDKKDFKFLDVGDSDKMKVGYLVIAIGNPFGLEGTVTSGIISAVGREEISLSKYDDFFQIDAAINPGNSGGALLNLKGELIGINTAIINYAQGIGFSITSNMVKQIIPELIVNGKITRGWLGISIQEVSSELAEKFNAKAHLGVLVSEVMEGSPAFSAKLKVGDIILKIDDVEITSMNKLVRTVGNFPVDKSIKLTILRDGETKILNAILAEKKAEVE